MSASIEAPALAGHTVADVMSSGVLACPADTPLHAAAAMMVVHRVHALAISDAPAQAPAILTDLDVVAAAAAPADTTAGEAASTPVAVRPADPLAVAARTMADRDRSHLLVMEPGARVPLGMLSTFDVAGALAGRDLVTARAVRPGPARPSIGTSRLERVAVAVAMHPGVFACAPEAGLREIAAMLVERRVHCVAIPSATPGEPWGIVTDLALMRAALADEDAHAGDIADVAPAWIRRDATLARAAEVMVREGASHLLVLGEGRPVGVLSSLDVLDALAAGPA